MNAAPHILVIGGQRSGKSQFAENLVARSGRRPVYVATATAGDHEMTARIVTHRARRGPTWATIEEPIELPLVLGEAAKENAAVLVDCLTLWLANLIAAERDIDGDTQALLDALAEAACPVVIVSSEVGAGIVPENALARIYADALGILNQRVATVVGRVVLVSAGQPLVLKPSQTPEISL